MPVSHNQVFDVTVEPSNTGVVLRPNFSKIKGHAIASNQ